MKKILTLSALTLILTGCANQNNLKDNSTNTEATTVVSTTTTQKIETITSESIDYGLIDEILKVYFESQGIPDLFVIGNTYGEKIELGVYSTLSRKLSGSKLVDVYNMLEEDAISKEEAISKLAGKEEFLTKVDSNYDIYKVKELIGNEDRIISKVIYFTGDDTVVAFSSAGVGGMGGLVAADKSEWKIENDSILIPTINQLNKKAGETIRLKANNKTYSGGLAKYKYYIAGDEDVDVDISEYAGDYVTDGGVHFFLSENGEARIAGYDYKLNVSKDSSGKIILSQDNGRSFVLENDKIIDNLNGKVTIFYKK